MNKIKKVLTVLNEFIATLFRIVFGQLEYQKPLWLTKILNFGRSMKRRRPQLWKRFWQTGLGTAMAGVLGVTGYYAYYHFRTQPHYVVATVAEPALPELGKPSPEVVRVIFSEPVAKVEMIGKEESQSIRMTPDLKGKWVWVSSTQIHFLPDSTGRNPYGWGIGADYTIKIKDQFFPKGLELEKSEISFKVKPLTVDIQSNEIYHDPISPKVQRATVTLSFNFPVDVEDIRRRISAKIIEVQSKAPKSQSLKIETSFDEQKTKVFVTTENITVPEADSKVIVKLEKGGLGLWSGEANEISADISVPGRNSLKIVSAEVQNVRNENFEPEQALVLESNLPINGKKLADQMEIYLLPKKKKNRVWTSATELDQKILAEAEAFRPELHPTETEESLSQSFNVKLPQNRQVYIRIKKGLSTAADYFMPFDFQTIVDVGSAPKEILIMGSGSLLSISGEKKIPLLSRNVSEIKVDLYRLLPEQLTQLSRQALVSGTFQRPYLPSNLLWDTSQRIEKVIAVGSDENNSENKMKSSDDETQYSSLNMDQILKPGQKGLFYVKLSENTKKNKQNSDSDYEYGNYDGSETGKDQRLILITDLGLVAKKNFSKSYTVFVQNLKTGRPVQGAKVQVLGRNGLPLLDVQSNEDGTAEVPNLSSFKREQTPSLFVVTLEEDLVFMPIDQSDRQLDFSKFDVGGIFENTDSDQLIGYLFSDRGIYRPGEEINIGYIVRNRLMSRISKDVPLEMVITAPDGVQVEKKMIRVSTDDISDFKWRTQDESPTGLYRFGLMVPDSKRGSKLVGEVEVRVEEFAPDELSIFTHYGVDATQGWLIKANEELKISVKNLFGTPASERKIESKFSVYPAQPNFRKFPGFRFSFNNKNNLGYEQALPDGETDLTGDYKQIIDLSKLSEGFYQVRVDNQAMQSGSGRSVYSRAISYFSTLPYLVGFKTESDLSFLRENSEHDLDLLAIDNQLQKTELKNIKLQLMQIQYVSTLLKQKNGLFKYQSIKKDKVIKIDDFELLAADNKIKIPTNLRGDFYFTLTDNKNRELTRIDFSVIGDGEKQRGFDKGSELKLTLNKKDFAPESEIELELRAPFAGSGLITIEREKVFAYKWFKSTTATSIQKIKIPAGIEGYAYINVSWLRSVDAKQIYMNPLSYAVESFSVSLDRRKNKLEIETPEIVKPGSQLNISYSATSPTPIILYGVNEGILQVAQYTNPNAVNFFFKRRALQVTTFQLLDLLRPEFSIIKALSGNQGTGGDMESGGGSMNLNPFKRKTDPPVVFWSGRLIASPKKQTFSYLVPEYFNGSMRIIAVSANQKTFGQFNSQVTVRGDLILTPSVPYFVAPGDEFESAVIVANQKRGSGEKAEVKIQVSADKLDAIGRLESNLIIPEGQEKTQFFTLKSKDILGDSQIKFKAELTGTVVERTLSVSIRPPHIYQTTFFTENIAKESSLKNSRHVYPEYSQGRVTLSQVPFSFITAAEMYLTNYDYSCSEQLISRALGFAALDQLGIEPTVRAQKMDLKIELKKIIQALTSRQNGDGGIALYPRSHSQTVLTPLVFLLNEQLKISGLSFPAAMMDGLAKNLTEIVVSEASSVFELRNAARGYYWLTLSGKLVTNKLEFLDKISEKSKDPVTKGYLAASFNILKMQSEANRLWQMIELHKKQIWSPEDFMSQTSSNSEIFYLAAKYNKSKLKTWLEEPDFKDYFGEIMNGQMQTQSAAWSLVAVVNILTMNENKTTFSASEETTTGVFKPLDFTGKIIKRAVFNPQAIAVKVKTDQDIFGSLVVGGFERTANVQQQIKGLEAERVYLVGGKETTRAKLGEDVTVRIRLKATEGKTIAHVVWLDLLPGGLEPKLESIVFGDAVDARGYEGQDSGEDQYDQVEPQNGEDQGDSGGFKFFKPENKVDMFAKAIFEFPRAHAESETGIVAQVPRYNPIYVDRREDRIVIYGHAPPQVVEYTYVTKAATVGKFVIPAFYGENMYDQQVFYKGIEGTFEVFK
jgi:alpha-2-macroglobulin